MVRTIQGRLLEDWLRRWGDLIVALDRSSILTLWASIVDEDG